MLVVVVVSTESGPLPTLELSLSLSLSLALSLSISLSVCVSSIHRSSFRPSFWSRLSFMHSVHSSLFLSHFSVHSFTFFSLRVLCISRDFSPSEPWRSSVLPAFSRSSSLFSRSLLYLFSRDLYLSPPPSPSFSSSLCSSAALFSVSRYSPEYRAGLAAPSPPTGALLDPYSYSGSLNF